MIYEASFSGIIRIIFWIFAIGFIIRLIANLALPHVMRKAEERMRENANRFRENQRPQRNEGDITIENGKSNSGSKSNGEYVDYVEIKD